MDRSFKKNLRFNFKDLVLVAGLKIGGRFIPGRSGKATGIGVSKRIINRTYDYEGIDMVIYTPG